MESIFTIILLFLAVFFLMMWLVSRSKNEENTLLTEELHGITDTLDRMAYSLTKLQRPTEPEASEIPAGEPRSLTKESVRTALRYNHLQIEPSDPDEPGLVRFTYEQVSYRINTSDLPHASLEAGFRFDPKEEDIGLMKQVAEEITYSMYMAKVIVLPEGFYVFQVDFLENTYLSLRDNLRHYLDLNLDAQHRFLDRYGRQMQERKQASQDALQTSLLAFQTDSAGNKILS